MEAATIATEIGYPVALKGLMPGVVRKSDAGLVAIGLNSAADVLREATLAGFRGRPPSDLQTVADAIGAVSWFITELADRISEVEINPLAVPPSGQGCRALDCVIIPRAESKHRTVV